MGRLTVAGTALFKLVDRATAFLAVVAAWLFVAAGAMLVCEVIARYIFVAPTIWAAELSLLCLIWGVYLGAAAQLRRRELIRITIIIGRLPIAGQRLAEAFSLLIIFGLCLAAIWYGADIAQDSFERHRTTGSMLSLPTWITEASIPVGFLLIGVQAFVELLRLLAGESPPAEDTTLS